MALNIFHLGAKPQLFITRLGLSV